LLVEDLPPARFVTMVFAVLDPAERTLTLASAGHLQPLLVHGEEARFLDTEMGLPLGLALGEYSETEIELKPGCRVLFYSDGITEAANPDEEEYGQLRLKEHLLQPGTSGESLLEDVRSFANGFGLHDDATVISVEMLL
jgi:sigma-B regulation protein RsbU (phosphoserine phosphatase)